MSVNSRAQSLNCKHFRDGTFTSTFEGNTDSIKRVGADQYEYFNGSKVADHYLVKWVDDCTYTLTPFPDVFEKNQNLPRNIIFTVKITKTTKNSYTQTTSNNISDYLVTCEIVKTK